MSYSGYVHPLRESIEYAVILFDSGENIERAIKLTKRIIELQETNDHSPFYGMWSYYLEEPLDRMSPPDFNWADFIAKQLLVIYIDFFDLIDDDLKSEIKMSVSAACKCIIKRNARASYTNIAVMDSFVCATAGEKFGISEFLEYGTKKLRKLVEFTRVDGNLNEYNSPVYTMVALEDIQWILYYVDNAQMKEHAKTFNEFLWECFASHYHVKTGELSGPQARNYSDFLTEEQKRKILCAAEIQEYSEDVALRDRLWVPNRFLDFFRKSRTHYEIIRISNGFCSPCFANSRVAFSYVSNDFCMGSFHHDEMWNQIRPLLGFFGDAENKYAFKIQTLHDGYDFSNAEIHIAQYYGSAVGVINFANDRGDTHICLDFIKNKRVTANDLRIRFKICGNVEKLKVVQDNINLCVTYLDTNINFEYLTSCFDGAEGKVEVSKSKSELCFDLVLYSGENKELVFDDTKDKYCAFIVDVNEDKKDIAQYSVLDRRINVKYKSMSVTTQTNSLPFTVMNVNDEILIKGKNVEELAESKLEL